MRGRKTPGAPGLDFETGDHWQDSEARIAGAPGLDSETGDATGGIPKLESHSGSRRLTVSIADRQVAQIWGES